MNYIDLFFKSDISTILKYFDGTDIPKIKLIDNQIYKVIENDKSSIAKSGVIFLEPLAMEYARRKGLPAPTVVGIAENKNIAIFVTQKITGYNGEELLKLNPKLESKMRKKALHLKALYSNFGIDREMHLKDLIFNVKDGDILDVIPVDFERIKINEKLDIKLLLKIANEMGINLSKVIKTDNFQKIFTPQQVNNQTNNNQQSKPVQQQKSSTQKKTKLFSQRSQTEIQVYQQIKEKNQLIKQHQSQMINNDNLKKLTLTQPSSNGSESNDSNGFVTTVILSLIVSFVTGALFMVAYMIIRGLF